MRYHWYIMTLVTLVYTHAIYTCHMSRHVYTCKWPWAAFSTLIGHIWAHVEPICINVSHVTMFVWRDQLCLSFFASKWLTLFVRIANEENKRQDSHRHNSSLQASSGCFKVFNPAIKPQLSSTCCPEVWCAQERCTMMCSHAHGSIWKSSQV